MVITLINNFTVIYSNPLNLPDCFIASTRALTYGFPPGNPSPVFPNENPPPNICNCMNYY